MVSYLIYKPIAVCVTTIAIALLGLLAFGQLPVSLLPDIPVPEITVQVNYPNATARELQRTIEQPIRNQLLQVNHLEDIESVTQDGLSILTLHFHYGSNTRLAYLETNEKIDAILGQMPPDLERPKVIKSGAGDIPVFTLNILPNPSYQADFIAFSDFCENVLKRRIEQLTDVALVDATGLAQPQATISVDPEKLANLGLTEIGLADLLKQANLQPSNFSVKEGPYKYNINFSSVLHNIQDVGNILISVGGSRANIITNAQNDPRIIYFANNVLTAQKTDSDSPRRLIRLSEIATISISEQLQKGLYTFNSRRGIALAIIKQNDAQLLHLSRDLKKLLILLKNDYPQLEFKLSQDQTELLDLSINNLISNLLTGALLTFILVFLFMNDRRLPLLIGLVIPVSISITFLGFYLLDLSINIVSLAGLILGMGEIVDSAIIIIENIEDKRDEGLSLSDSCIRGTEEVIRPLFTSVLTNSAVFLPLLIISGLAGAIFFDQAVSVSLALGISLFCSYSLVPVLYYLLYKNDSKQRNTQSPIWVMYWLQKTYLAVFSIAFRFRKIALICLLLFLGSATGIAYLIEKQGMPNISRTELEVYIDWNEPLTVAQNELRITQLVKRLKIAPVYVSAFIGQQQFLLNRQIFQTENVTLLSLKVNSAQTYTDIAHELVQKIKRQYPESIVDTRPARNVFELLFDTSKPPLRLKLYNPQGQQMLGPIRVDQVSDELIRSSYVLNAPSKQRQLTVRLRPEQILLYDVDEATVLQTLKTVFNNNQITNLQSDQRFIPLFLSRDENIVNDTTKHWQSKFVYNRHRQGIPLSALIEIIPNTDYKIFYADKEGAYVPFDFTKISGRENSIQVRVNNLLKQKKNLLFKWTGSYFYDKSYLNELLIVGLISIALLLCILTAQFESFLQPLIILLIITLGLAGAVWFLYIAGDSLNILSVIGMVVLIGLLDNDAILKIDTINRSINSMSLMDAIRSAGLRRLKSQFMTFMTTILSLIPVLFSGGLGSELQRPLALSVIGGMCVGMLISWTIIPLLYWWLVRSKTDLLISE